MRPFLEGGKLPVAQLVGDAAWILVSEVVDSRALPVPEGAQCRGRELRRERQGLQAGKDAVATEHRHEPREAGGRQASSSRDRRREAKSREVDETAPIGRLQRVPVTFDARRFLEPPFEVRLHDRFAATAVRVVLRSLMGHT